MPTVSLGIERFWTATRRTGTASQLHRDSVRGVLCSYLRRNEVEAPSVIKAMTKIEKDTRAWVLEDTV